MYCAIQSRLCSLRDACLALQYAACVHRVSVYRCLSLSVGRIRKERRPGNLITSSFALTSLSLASKVYSQSFRHASSTGAREVVRCFAKRAPEAACSCPTDVLAIFPMLRKQAGVGKRIEWADDHVSPVQLRVVFVFSHGVVHNICGNRLRLGDRQSRSECLCRAQKSRSNWEVCACSLQVMVT